MIHWMLTEQQADQILAALGQQPFIQVQGLIGELIRQANPPREPLLPDAALPAHALGGEAPQPLANGSGHAAG